MAYIPTRRLMEANDFAHSRLVEAKIKGRIIDEDFCQTVARASLAALVPELLGIAGRSVEIEALACKAISDEGVTAFEEVAYRGAYYGALLVRNQTQGVETGNIMTTYSFAAQSTQVFDRATNSDLRASDHVFVDFDKIETIKLYPA